MWASFRPVLLFIQMLLLGADEGLFAVNITKGQHTLVTKLAGLKNIHHMVYASGLGWVICITGLYTFMYSFFCLRLA